MAVPVSVSRDGLDAPELFAVASNEVLHTVRDTNHFILDKDEEIWLQGQIPHHNLSQLIGNFCGILWSTIDFTSDEIERGAAGTSERCPDLMHHTDLYDNNLFAEKW
jgi:hypothetical protein